MRELLLSAIIICGAVLVEAQAPGRNAPPAFFASAFSDWHTGTDGIARMNLVGDSMSATGLQTFRLRYPANVGSDSTRAAVHFHLGTEHIIVLRGTLVVGFGEQVDYGAVKAYGPEGFVVIPSGKPHYEWTRGETEIEVEAIGPTRTIPYPRPTNPGATRVQAPARDTAVSLVNGLPQWSVSPNGMARMNLVGGTPPSPTELIAFRIHYPPKFLGDSAPIIYHYHFGTEHITVLHGTIYIGFGDHVDRSKAKAYGPGSFIENPAGTPHFEWFGEVEAHIEAVGNLSAIALDPVTGQPR